MKHWTSMNNLCIYIYLSHFTLLFSQIGGVFGLFIGASFMSFVEIAEWMFNILRAIYRNKVKEVVKTVYTSQTKKRVESANKKF